MRYLITSALPYANGPIHIGHLAGAYLPADIYTRYLRMRGKDVVYVCGSDEHGAAITIRAKKDGVSPQAVIDKYDESFRKTFAGIGISFDKFHRTSAPIHHDTTQEFFRNLYEKGEFVEKKSEQYFDEEANSFLADRYILGVCPKCANPDAYGDQCERCGSTLSPDELLAPIRSTLSSGYPVKKETSHWYLPLDKYEPWLKEWMNTGVLDGTFHHDPKDWKNHVLGQCKSWLEGGLQPRAMTRDLDWGIDVPQEIPNSAGKKIYVWMDAPIGYISATKQWALENKKDWKSYWQDKDSKLIHFIGKDNIVFHCLIFPAILKAHGGYNLPINVPANQFMNLEGRKISTSKNWAVWVHEYLEDFPGKEDVLRYNMVKNMPEQKDSEFTWRGFQETTNTELVNNIANFINRVVVLTNKYYDGKVPSFDANLAVLSSADASKSVVYADEIKSLEQKLKEYSSHIESFDFRNGLQTVMEISSLGNQLLQANEPWKTIKTDAARTAVVMNLGIQYVAILGTLCRPFLPFTSDAVAKLLKTDLALENGELNGIEWHLQHGKSIIPADHQIGEPIHLFTRITDEEVEIQTAKLVAANALSVVDEPEIVKDVAVAYSPIKETIGYDDFSKMDIRTGKITAAERVPKADKLLKLTVDLGFETRTVVSGIAQHFEPDAIIGQDVIVLANLAPRPLRGIESNGMILMSEDSDGKLQFVKSQVSGSGFVVK
jgi:methionyl-tRNA synthetase